MPRPLSPRRRGSAGRQRPGDGLGAAAGELLLGASGEGRPDRRGCGVAGERDPCDELLAESFSEAKAECPCQLCSARALETGVDTSGAGTEGSGESAADGR
ncbi:hypothetical protein R6Z07F_010929 [Ovis aries]